VGEVTVERQGQGQGQREWEEARAEMWAVLGGGFGGFFFHVVGGEAAADGDGSGSCHVLQGCLQAGPVAHFGEIGSASVPEIEGDVGCAIEMIRSICGQR